MSFIKAVRGDDDEWRPRPTVDVPIPQAGAWEPTPYAASALERECNKLAAMAPNTGRNSALNIAALNMGQLAEGGEISHEQVQAALFGAAMACGLGQIEATRTIRSGFKKARERPRTAPPREQVTLTTLPAQREGEPTEERLWPAPVDWKAVWDNPTELEWILEPFIPAGRYLALYSPPKVGKSLLMLELAVAISNGREALGAPTRKTRVLYIDRENDIQTDIRVRLEDMGHTYGDLDNLIYHSYLMDMPDLDTPEGGLYLRGIAEHHGAELVIIDTVSRFIRGEENDNNTWIKLHKHAAMPLKEKGIGLLRLDHSGKDLERGQRGGSAKLGDIDMVWRMTEIDPQVKYELRCEAHRIPVTESNLILTREPSPLRHTVDTRRWQEVKEEVVIKALDDAGLDPAAGRIQCSKVLTAAGIKIRTTTLAGIIKRRQLRLT